MPSMHDTAITALIASNVWSNDQDLVIANSPHEASGILQRRCGCDGTIEEGHEGHHRDQLWERLDDTQEIRIHGMIADARTWRTGVVAGWIGRLSTVGGNVMLGRRNLQNFEEAA